MGKPSLADAVQAVPLILVVVVGGLESSGVHPDVGHGDGHLADLLQDMGVHDGEIAALRACEIRKARQTPKLQLG